jgi:hypothetical protein
MSLTEDSTITEWAAQHRWPEGAVNGVVDGMKCYTVSDITTLDWSDILAQQLPLGILAKVKQI